LNDSGAVDELKSRLAVSVVVAVLYFSENILAEVNMKKTLLVSLLSLCSMSLPGVTMAQRMSGDIVESTDPARAAEVQRHAEEIRAQQGRPPAPPESGPPHHPMKKHHHKRHHGKGPHGDMPPPK
jgi:hypothetical protein